MVAFVFLVCLHLSCWVVSPWEMQEAPININTAAGGHILSYLILYYIIMYSYKGLVGCGVNSRIGFFGFGSTLQGTIHVLHFCSCLMYIGQMCLFVCLESIMTEDSVSCWLRGNIKLLNLWWWVLRA